MDGSPEYNTYSAISLATTPSSAGADWNVTYPDGTISFYGYRYGNQTGLDRFYTNYLSWVKDPQGRQMTFNYLTTNNVVLLTSVVDYDNRTNLFIYDTNFLYQVSRVIDPYYCNVSRSAVVTGHCPYH